MGVHDSVANGQAEAHALAHALADRLGSKEWCEGAGEGVFVHTATFVLNRHTGVASGSQATMPYDLVASENRVRQAKADMVSSIAHRGDGIQFQDQHIGRIAVGRDLDGHAGWQRGFQKRYAFLNDATKRAWFQIGWRTSTECKQLPSQLRSVFGSVNRCKRHWQSRQQIEHCRIIDLEITAQRHGGRRLCDA